MIWLLFPIYMIGFVVYPVLRIMYIRPHRSSRPPSFALQWILVGPIWFMVAAYDLLSIVVRAPFIIVGKARKRNYRR